MYRLLTLGILLLAGCAAMEPGDSRRTAEMDHAACVDQGYAWPSAEYERCRWELQSDRHRRTWDNLQLMERPRIDQGTMQPHEHYRPLPRINFKCRERRTEAGDIWIDCGSR